MAESNFGNPDGKARIRHPITAFCHVFFRVSALIVYLILSSFFSGHFIELFLTVILLLAFDFWIVKNISGRLLVGLRWWNKVEEDGTSTWIFESKKVSVSSGPESMIFWVALFACPLLWIFCLFTAAVKLKFEWAIITIMGIALNGANVVGYIKCRRDAGVKLTKMAGQFIGNQILQQTLNQSGDNHETINNN